MRWRRVPLLFLRAGRKFRGDNCSHMAAAVAYYALFSIFPLILALVSLAAFFIGSTSLEDEIPQIVGSFFPVSQSLIVDTIAGVIAARGTIGVVALAGLLWSATAVFAALTRSLNAAWDVPPSRALWRQKLVELAMFGWVGLLLIASMLIATTVALVRRFELPLWSQLMEAGGWLTDLGLALVPLLFAFATFWVLYRVVPHVPVRWGDLWLGAVVAALGFEGGKYLFVWYLSAFASYNAVYGPLSAVVAFLTWVYISVVVVLFGAEVASEYPKVMA